MGTPCQKIESQWTKVASPQEFAPFTSPGAMVNMWGYSGAGSYQCRGPVMHQGEWGGWYIDIQAGGVGRVLTKRDDKTV